MRHICAYSVGRCAAGAIMAIALAVTAVAEVNFESAVGIWLFDDGNGKVAEDSSGNGVDGALIGGAEWIDDGAFGKALEFNGSDACVETGQQLLEAVTDFTVTLWLRTGGTGGDRVGLVGQNDTVEFGLISPTTMQLWSEGGGGSHDQPWVLSDDEWHHVAGTGTPDVLRLYIDGAMTEGALVTADHGTSAFFVNIGGCGIYDGTGNWFTGGIDEVGIFHEALPEEDVLTLMEDGFKQTLAVSARGKAAVTWGGIKAEAR
jgi:hypothetical protein